MNNAPNVEKDRAPSGANDTRFSNYAQSSDLAAECCAGCTQREYSTPYASVAALDITDADEAKRLKKPLGSYVTISFGSLWTLNEEGERALARTLADELRELARHAAPSYGSVLICGLGNRALTSDALGPLCIDSINVTRHLKCHDRRLFEALETCEISAVAPGVVGQTGIETLELIRGAVATVKPELLVAIDALAARSVERLASTIQLTDSGIAPGSGIGNSRCAVSRESTGVPTIAIGAPTVVSSATLIESALERAGIDTLPPELGEVLRTGRSFFVSPKECDIAVAALARVIADALNLVFFECR